jgi:hypothetical protein
MLQGQHAGLSASRSQSRLQRNGERPTWQRLLHEYRGSPLRRASGAVERAGTAPMSSRGADPRNLQDRVHVVYRSNLPYLSCMFVRPAEEAAGRDQATISIGASSRGYRPASRSMPGNSPPPRSRRRRRTRCAPWNGSTAKRYWWSAAGPNTFRTALRVSVIDQRVQSRAF